MPNDRGQFLKGEHWRMPKPHWQKAWLESKYVIGGMSAGDIAAECGCTEENIYHWLRKHGTSRRSISQARSLKHWGASGKGNPMFGRKGSANPRYVDGSSPERQRLYVQGAGREFLRTALAFGDYKCRRCSAVSTGRKSLHVHHLRTWAGNPDLRFDLGNVVVLCRTCHSFVHSKANAKKEFLL